MKWDVPYLYGPLCGYFRLRDNMQQYLDQHIESVNKDFNSEIIRKIEDTLKYGTTITYIGTLQDIQIPIPPCTLYSEDKENG